MITTDYLCSEACGPTQIMSFTYALDDISTLEVMKDEKCAWDKNFLT